MEPNGRDAGSGIAHEVVLYRCDCVFCKQSEKKLDAICARLGVRFKAVWALSAGLKTWPGVRTPCIFVDGKEVSRFSVAPMKWEEAIKRAIST